MAGFHRTLYTLQVFSDAFDIEGKSDGVESSKVTDGARGGLAGWCFHHDSGSTSEEASPC
jgi:hypothetical protein